MKSTVLSVVAAQAAVAAAAANPPGNWGANGGNWGGYGGGNWNGWGGVAQCGNSCYSSYWQTATPTPGAYCDAGGDSVGKCVQAACTGDAAAYSTFSSVSSSLCSQYKSCSSTGTYTYTYTKPTGVADWWGGDKTKDWPSGAVTVTGCPWNGGDVGWGNYGWGPGGRNWGDFGPGWTYSTWTTTVTSTAGPTGTGSAASGARFTTIGTATVAQAVNGAQTTQTTFTGAFDSLPTATPNAAPTDGLNGVKVMGAALGAVVVAAGLM